MGPDREGAALFSQIHEPTGIGGACGQGKAVIPKMEIWEAFKKVKENQGAAGVDGQSIASFEVNLSNNLYKLWNRLSSGLLSSAGATGGNTEGRWTDMRLGDRSEIQWQDFFEREQWIFGYGLDCRVMQQFGREMTVGAGGSDNQNKPVIDFLMTFTEYTVLVEIKTPETPIFTPSRRGRAGTWEFSREFISAVAQIIEQKAEWLSFAQTGEHDNKEGTEAGGAY
jgi:hypothetical protein